MTELFNLENHVGFAQMKSLLMEELAEATVASVDTILDDNGEESLSIGFDNGARLILEAFYVLKRDELLYDQNANREG